MNIIVLIGAVVLLTIGIPVITEDDTVPEQPTQKFEITVPEIPRTQYRAYAQNEGETTTPGETKKPVSYSQLQYPNSQPTEDNSTSALYTSADSPLVITNWYKNQIKALNFNVRSFIQTSINGTVNNKLVTSNGESDISVDITKDALETHTTIRVSKN